LINSKAGDIYDTCHFTDKISGLFFQASNLSMPTMRRRALRNGLQRSGKRGIFKTHKKVGFKQVLERYDGILGFSKTNIHFEEREFDRKLVNGHAELVFGKSAA
jgi:hypothetical protein